MLAASPQSARGPQRLTREVSADDSRLISHRGGRETEEFPHIRRLRRGTRQALKSIASSEDVPQMVEYGGQYREHLLSAPHPISSINFLAPMGK